MLFIHGGIEEWNVDVRCMTFCRLSKIFPSVHTTQNNNVSICLAGHYDLSSVHNMIHHSSNADAWTHSWYLYGPSDNKQDMFCCLSKLSPHSI